MIGVTRRPGPAVGPPGGMAQQGNSAMDRFLQTALANQGAPPPGLNIQAQTNPQLEALQGRANKYMDDLQAGTGHAMDLAGQKMRDAREGGRQALGTSEGMRGVASSNRMGQYEADTQRGVTRAIADTGLERERMLGSAIQGSLGIARAPGEMALQEKGFGLSAYQAQQQANQQQFSNFMALLNAQRQSPIYGGF